MNRLVNVTNKKEVAFFLKQGIKPSDMFLSDNDRETIVFQYNKYDTNELHREFIKNYIEK